MNIDAKHENASVDFSVLKLKPGTWLKLQNMENAKEAYSVEFVASVHQSILYVAMADVAAEKIRLKFGDQFMVRGFNGVRDFSFTTKVLEVQIKPFVNIHLTYPAFVDSRVVREALRMSTSLPVSVLLAGTSQLIAAQVNDLSVAGALIESTSPLGEVGAHIGLNLRTRFESSETELHLKATIRHVEHSEMNGTFRNGVEFIDIGREDKLVLYYLLFTLGASF